MILKYTVCDNVEAKCYGLYDSEEDAQEALHRYVDSDDSIDPDDYDIVPIDEKFPE